MLLDYIAAEDKANLSYTIVQHKLLNLIPYKKTIEVTYGTQTESYQYNAIKGNVIVKSDWLVNNFGFERSKVEHQPGDVFNSVDHAALAWSLKYYPLSNDRDDQYRREFGSAIYEKGDGFAFSEPNRSDDNSRWSVALSLPHDGYRMVAGIHTHPNLNTRDLPTGVRPEPEKFSMRDDLLRPDGDLKWVARNRVPLYVVTPSRKVRTLTVTDRFESNNPKYSEATVFGGIKQYLK